jgi:deoxyribonuclease-2
MDVETWSRGPIAPTLDSDAIHKTFDIKLIDLRPFGTTWTWPDSKDHAKSGLTVGDMNRKISQEQRGGGTIAFQDAKLWSELKRTDLIVPPPGHSDAEARAMIKATHGSASAAKR